MPNVVCKDGVCYLVEETNTVASAVVETTSRIAHGYMNPTDFLSFLNGVEPSGMFSGMGLGMTLLLILLGGLAMNLTPCVLPMVPINLMIIGRSFKRGLLYALGIALAYGAMGLLAALGGMAFGTIQSSIWFNIVIALIFVALGCALSGVFNIDLSRYRFRTGAFLMGALSAVLAGACVAPILISVLLLTAKLYAEGNFWALFLPFVLGLGMALPWPFLGAGMNVLPKPGKWMKWVNRLFALLVFAFAAYYGYLAYRGSVVGVSASTDLTPTDFAVEFAKAKKPVLVDCWASWCKNCAAMERTTLKDPAVIEALKPYTVIRLKSEDLSELRQLPGFEAVKGLPAFVIFEN